MTKCIKRPQLNKSDISTPAWRRIFSQLYHMSESSKRGAWQGKTLPMGCSLSSLFQGLHLKIKSWVFCLLVVFCCLFSVLLTTAETTVILVIEFLKRKAAWFCLFDLNSLNINFKCLRWWCNEILALFTNIDYILLWFYVL